MKIVVIAVITVLALIGGGVVMLGGTGYFVHVKVESRAAEIEEAMMAEMSRCAPEGLSQELLDGQRVIVKKLARTAAQIEMAEAFKDKNQRIFKEETPLPKSGLECPKIEPVRVGDNLKRYQTSYQQTQATSSNMDNKDWTFGDPVVDVSATQP
jgi:hypothetical protein